MKLRWGWMLATAVVCLLWSLIADTSLNPAASFDQHLVAWSADSCSPSSYPSLTVLSQDWIRTRAGPQNIFLTPDVSRSLPTEDLDPEGPLWLESHGPPGKYRALGQPGGPRVAVIATEALQRGGNYLATVKFFGHRPPEIKIPGFATCNFYYRL